MMQVGKTTRRRVQNAVPCPAICGCVVANVVFGEGRGHREKLTVREDAQTTRYSFVKVADLAHKRGRAHSSVLFGQYFRVSVSLQCFEWAPPSMSGASNVW